MPLTKEQRNERYEVMYGADVDTVDRETLHALESEKGDHARVAMSVLSDAQYLMCEAGDSETARQRINFAKHMLMGIIHSHPCDKESLLEEQERLLKRLTEIGRLLKTAS